MPRASVRLTMAPMREAVAALFLAACHSTPPVEAVPNEMSCGGYFPERECQITFEGPVPGVEGETIQHYLEDASFRLNLATDPTPDAPLYQAADPTDPYAPCRVN